MPQADPYSAVPKSSVLLLESSNVTETLEDLSQTQVFQEIDSLPFLLAYAYDLNELSNLFNADSLERFFEDRSILLSLSLSGASEYGLLYTTSVSANEAALLTKKLQKHYPYSNYTYAEHIIVKIEAQKHFFICAMNGLLVASTEQNLVEKAVRQIASGFNLKSEAHFKRVYETANKKEQANLYVNFSEVSTWLKTYFPNGNSAFLSKLGSWAELDLSVLNKEVLLNGLTLIPQNEQSLLSSFEGIDAQVSAMSTILPSTFSTATSYLFNSAESWQRNYYELEQNRGNAARLTDFRKILSTNFELNADEYLLHWIDNEIGCFQLENSASQNPKVAFFKARDTDKALKLLEKLSDVNAISGHRGVVIRRLNVKNPHRYFFGTLFSGFVNPYFFDYRDYIIYTNNLNTAKSLIDDYLAENTTDKQEAYQEFASMLPAKAHVFNLTANANFLKTIQSALPAKEAEKLKQQQEKLAKFQYTAVQFTVKKDAAYSNIYVQHNPAKKERVNRLWTCVLEAPALTPPTFVLNHSNRKQEILIQDRNYKLYLIDRQGKILWSKLLDGAVLGEIKQVDIFKNRKLQYVFNTSNQVYVIDRLGRDVENFPIVLKEPSSAPMAVVDYDNNRKYRFLVPSGENLLNFSVSGEAVKGWSFEGNKSTILHTPELIRASSKEVITVYTADNTLRFLYRNGKDRYPSHEIELLKEGILLKEGQDLDNAQLTGFNKNGQLVFININGTNEALPLEAGERANHYLHFDERDIFSVDEKLFVKSAKKPWIAELNGNISTIPKAMIFGGDFYAAAYSADAEEIRLFDKNGELIDGFPVYAQGPFDMGSLGRNSVINIVTSTKDGTVICYAIN